MKRGQVSIELIAAVGILFIILLFLASLSFRQGSVLKSSDAYLSQRKDCIELSSMIVGVYVGGNGTVVRNDLSFDVDIFPNDRVIEINEKEIVTCTIPLNAVSSVSLNKGNIELRNVGDFVEVSNV